MKSGLKKGLSMLMVALLLLTSVPAMSYAVQTTGTLSVSASGSYVNEATVTGLPSPYVNGTYTAFCGDKNAFITPNTQYATTFSAYTDSRRIAYLINSDITTDKKVVQQLIWRIINGGYNNPGDLEATANALWQQYFQSEAGLDKETQKMVYADKVDTAFAAVDSLNYTKTIFLGNTGSNVQPILVVAQKIFPRGTVVVTHTFVGNPTMDAVVNLEGSIVDTFTTVALSHVGYTYTTEGPLTGHYTVGVQNVQYTYTAIPAPTGKVFVKHENPDGSPYAVGSSVEGLYNATYTVSPLETTTHVVTLKVESAPVTGVFNALDATVTFVYTPKVIIPTIEAPTEAPTQAPTEAPTQAPTEAPTQAPTQAPTEAPTQATTEEPESSTVTQIIATTEATTVVIIDEEVAAGDGNNINFDSFFNEPVSLEIPEATVVTTEVATEVATVATTEALEEVEIAPEATPLADALPETGQLPVELFYGVGGLISAAGIFLKNRK